MSPFSGSGSLVIGHRVHWRNPLLSKDAVNPMEQITKNGKDMALTFPHLSSEVFWKRRKGAWKGKVFTTRNRQFPLLTEACDSEV